jgi:glycosyltransferase involved in cell wall biosynthesis
MKIIGGIITRNAEFMFKPSIQSYIDILDKLYVVDDGSTDGTLDIASSFPKVEIIRGDYGRNKGIQRQVYLDKAEDGDFIFCPDSDEVYDDIGLVLGAIVDGFNCVVIRHLNFWKCLDKIIRGHVWDQRLQRGFTKQSGMSYVKCHHSVLRNGANYYSECLSDCSVYGDNDQLLIHHYGWIKSEAEIWDKVCYYMRRDNPNCVNYRGNVDDRLVKEYAHKHPFFSGDFNYPRYGGGGLYCCGYTDDYKDVLHDWDIENHPSVVKETDFYKERVRYAK